jgi:hypothetical protein
LEQLRAEINKKEAPKTAKKKKPAQEEEKIGQPVTNTVQIEGDRIKIPMNQSSNGEGVQRKRDEKYDSKISIKNSATTGKEAETRENSNMIELSKIPKEEPNPRKRPEPEQDEETDVPKPEKKRRLR